MALELTESECDQIRKAIDIRMDAVILPDETILLGIYGPYACSLIAARMPEGYAAETYDPRLLPACIFTCAALLIPAIKQLQTEKIAGGEKTFKTMDWDKKVLELNSRADQIVTSVLTEINGSSSFLGMRPTFFTLGKARRGC